MTELCSEMSLTLTWSDFYCVFSQTP